MPFDIDLLSSSMRSISPSARLSAHVTKRAQVNRSEGKKSAVAVLKDYQALRQANVLTLDDFDSKKVQLASIPKAASQTCQGQVLIKPIIEPIPYGAIYTPVKKLTARTIAEFKLSKRDVDRYNGLA